MILADKKLVGLMLGLLGVLGFVNTANAVPVEVSVDVAGSYSLIHPLASNSGPGDPADWLRFDTGQTMLFDFSGNVLTLDGAQTFSLFSNNGAVSSIDILAAMFDLNDSDGFLSGSIDYDLDGLMGTFSFANQQYFGSDFNSTIFNGSDFNVWAWGGDDANGLGMDLVMTGTIPEPGTLVLIALGVAGLGLSRRFM